MLGFWTSATVGISRMSRMRVNRMQRSTLRYDLMGWCWTLKEIHWGRGNLFPFPFCFVSLRLISSRSFSILPPFPFVPSICYNTPFAQAGGSTHPFCTVGSVLSRALELPNPIALAISGIRCVIVSHELFFPVGVAPFRDLLPCKRKTEQAV